MIPLPHPDLSPTKRRPRTRLGLNVLVAVLAVTGSVAGLELVFRHLLFGNYAFMAPWRDPLLYADGDSSDDYWLLRVRFGAPPAPRNDRLLGYVKPDITPGTYTHRQAVNLQGRTPVLLYGDSFAGCATPPADCFEGLFNADPRFADTYYLLNYGVGAYGLDQIALLYRNSVDHFEEPIVIFSFLDGDMDRGVLSLREGQKPYFEIEDGRLQLRGLPIEMEQQRFFDRQRPRITCYVGNLVIRRLFSHLAGSNSPLDRTRQTKQDLTRAILEEVAADLKHRKLRYVFLVFEGLHRTGQRPLNWRIRFLEEFFAERRLPHIWTRAALEEAVPPESFRVTEFIISEQNHHPNRRANAVIAARLREWLETGRTD